VTDAERRADKAEKRADKAEERADKAEERAAAAGAAKPRRTTSKVGEAQS